MKFKMSQNSIFAVLMRSPWWMSAGLALLLSVGGAAALPRDFAAVGVFAAVPFVVIAVLAGVRQWRQPSEERVLAVAQALAGMGWKEAAAAFEAGFTRDGSQVQRLDGPGADFALQRKGRVAVVSARRWKAARIGIEPLRELQAARQQRGAQEAVFVALGEVSDNAWVYAREHGIALMAGLELARLLRHQRI